MESEAFDEGMNWDCNEYDTLARVKQVYKTPYFIRLKQFYLRLIQNNLFIVKSARNNIPQSCFFCAKHPEKRIPIIFSCDIVKEMTAKLIHILKEAGLLVMGDTIEMFLFVNYDFNSIKNFNPNYTLGFCL